MYPYISREDSYYTDTDSVVLGKPLPDEMISSSILGLFKLEDRISEGHFLALKTYTYTHEKGMEIVKYNGDVKEKITAEWFKSQCPDPDRKQEIQVEAYFRIDWPTLNIKKIDQSILVGINLGLKRIHVWERDTNTNSKKWVDTEPISVYDMSRLYHISQKLVKLV
ncbi:DNA-directed DNA polymerase, family B, conserved site-containing protein [Cynara cardunculus var. scolymus]|uniref:DNA-directed DNA polymerase, family B, conserved site-containing protein n=1 Tax=Cynara cardunculus var. scolymus TaxID=59895 RepID=A0A103XCW2_CYNCS|nr:DNA-directed DNA polymerase, family B, conserved site-containing protein [Cynara cardunculus var. scolymus]